MMMRSCVEEGRLQVTAAACLLQHSGLLRWQGPEVCTAVDWQAFEDHWRRIDAHFGRFICWITFSAGAELLIKGICLAHGVDLRQNSSSFGTLSKTLSCLGGLFEKVPAAGTAEKKSVRTTYGRLMKIRNRDVHAYWPNVRDDDFDLVAEFFIPCFNLLMSWLPPGSRMSDAELATFLASDEGTPSSFAPRPTQSFATAPGGRPGPVRVVDDGVT